MTQTTNYDLNKFESTDKLNPTTLNGLNDNAEKIDTALNELDIGKQNALTITSNNIRIWELDDGIYILNQPTTVYLNGASGTESQTYSGILNVTTSNSRKYWNLFKNNGTQNSMFVYGYTAESTYWSVSSMDLATYQKKSDLVTSITSSSTNTQYPSAKAVYDYFSSMITYGTTDIGEGATLTDGTFYFVYE